MTGRVALWQLASNLYARLASCTLFIEQDPGAEQFHYTLWGDFEHLGK